MSPIDNFHVAKTCNVAAYFRRAFVVGVKGNYVDYWEMHVAEKKVFHIAGAVM
jgi:hypothetical protein